MLEAEANEVPAPRPRERAAMLRLGLAALVCLVATVLLALRAPAAFRGIDAAASAAAGRNNFGGALAGADSLAIDNDFVRAALGTLPATARYSVLLPPTVQVAQQTYGIDPITLDGLPRFMLEILLPRLPVTKPGPGDYILCYDCDTSPWDHRTHWLWKNSEGHLVGQVYR